ncbi:MAG: HAD-IA family hydrolase [Phycisphaeraceae bacterium]|nr:MAG: HAD-IA family hydrolase [Phycisphaeraceae bacterium]
MGGLYSPDEVERVHHAWLIGEYPGAGRLIDDLHAAGHATALLSNTNHAHWVRQQPSTDSTGRLLPHFPAAAALTHRLASHTLGLAKPDPRIYESLERSTGLRPHQILFFDDLPENTAAAADRGWLTFTVDHTGDTASEMRTHLRSLGLLP